MSADDDREQQEFDLRATYLGAPQHARLTERHMRRRYVGIGSRHFINDTLVQGFALMVTPTGHKSLVFRYRYKGKTDKITYKTTDVEQARASAAAARATLLAGDNPKPRLPAPTEGITLREVVRAYLGQRQFKSQGQFARSLHNHVFPTLGDRAYESITRQDLAKLRDDIARRVGRHASNYALRCLNAVWTNYYRDHASEGFTWPQVGSPLTDADREGKGRALSDREVREVWQATFRIAPNKGAWIRWLFLTGMRRTRAATITREQIADDWSKIAVPGSPTKPAYDLMLSGAARELLREYFPEGARYAFEPLGGYGQLKTLLDIQVGQIAPWTFHDARHTARSLLSRVATPDIAELCIGHALKGIRKTYDHHLYEPEKLAAMEGLATLLREVVRSTPVVSKQRRHPERS